MNYLLFLFLYIFYIKMNLKKITSIIKLKINSNSNSLNTKMSTVLAQRRINSTEFFEFFKHKLNELNIKTTHNVLLKVFIFIFDLDDYIVYIKMPSLSNLLNNALFLNKNFKLPGYLFNITTNTFLFNYIITPYIIYEIIRYKYMYENLQKLSLFSFYKKNIHSLKSKGFNLFICNI